MILIISMLWKLLKKQSKLLQINDKLIVIIWYIYADPGTNNLPNSRNSVNYKITVIPDKTMAKEVAMQLDRMPWSIE